MDNKRLAQLIGGSLLVLLIVICGASASYVVQPGHRGVEVTLGKVSTIFKPEGFGFKIPFITVVEPQLIRQRTAQMRADCYSSDLQQVKIDVRVLYRVPEASVVSMYREYSGEPFESLVQPRVAEALNEITALRTAELIVQKREDIKNRALESARRKIGNQLVIEDVVLESINLTQALEGAIEAKMVQEQEAARARFAQQQVEIEANTVVIKAKGEAESINLRGKALRENPEVLDLQIVERWDGLTPLVIGEGLSGAEMILPLGLPGANRPLQEVKP